MLLVIRQISRTSFDDYLEELRGLGSNYFTKLEEAIRDSLSYAAWALTSDHFVTPEPFVYRDDRDGVPAFILLNEASKNDPPDKKVHYDDRPSLYSLCRGYERLAVILSDLLTERASHKRKASDYPSWSRDPRSLQVFPFDHTAAFLDLAHDSQEHILETLREVSKVLTGVEIYDLRNKLAHPRFTFQDIEPLRASLTATRDMFAHLESDGFSRQTFTVSSITGDVTQRETITLAHSRGYKYQLHMPNSYSWLRMPRGMEPQYIMQAARIAGSADVLRFRRRVYSPFAEMYNSFPIRPARASRASVSQSPDTTAAEGGRARA